MLYIFHQFQKSNRTVQAESSFEDLVQFWSPFDQGDEYKMIWTQIPFLSILRLKWSSFLSNLEENTPDVPKYP